MSWLEIYAPLGRLDAGLLAMLAVWLGTVAAGVVVWSRGRRRAPDGEAPP